MDLTGVRNGDNNPTPYRNLYIVAKTEGLRMPGEDPLEPEEIVKSALKGDMDSRRRFQELFGQFIYDYPLKTFRLPKEKSADFYIYVFEDDRIFRRLATFSGRNDAQFKTYLRFYVLRDLFFEWQRGRKDVETVSLDTPLFTDGQENESTLKDFIAPTRDPVEDAIESREAADRVHKFLADLDIEQRVLLKLIHLSDFDLTPQEIRFVSQRSGRSLRDTVALLEQVRADLGKKDERLNDLQGQLDSIFGWILLYQKELVRLTG